MRYTMELGIGGILGLIFVTLKLCNVIDWSWFWVLSPFWISAIIAIITIVTASLIYIFKKR